MDRAYLVVDAFASEPLTGNPAAVLPDAEGLTDGQMQAIAAEFNLSETAFILPPTDPVRSGDLEADRRSDLSLRFRWFTPTTEVTMCGHATIAGVHALIECGKLHLGEGAESATVRIETLSGNLTAFVERIPGTESERMIWLDMIDPTLTPLPLVKPDLASALGLPVDAFDASLPAAKTQDRDVLVFVRDFQTLNEAKPDFRQLASLLTRHRLRGLSNDGDACFIIQRPPRGTVRSGMVLHA